MEHKVLGIDLDGVLVNFNAGYIRTLTEVSGRAMVPENFEPPCWSYAEQVGYSREEDNAAWKAIRANPKFWYDLNPLPGAITALDRLHARRLDGHEVYFITSRPGVRVHDQSVKWLEEHGFPRASVLIDRGGKGHAARALGLTHFIDDRPENCVDVMDFTGTTKVFMPRRSYNTAAQACVDRAVVSGRWRCVEGIGEFISEAMA